MLYSFSRKEKGRKDQIGFFVYTSFARRLSLSKSE